MKKRKPLTCCSWNLVHLAFSFHLQEPGFEIQASIWCFAWQQLMLGLICPVVEFDPLQDEALLFFTQTQQYFSSLSASLKWFTMLFMVMAFFLCMWTYPRFRMAGSFPVIFSPYKEHAWKEILVSVVRWWQASEEWYANVCCSRVFKFWISCSYVQ